MTRFKKLMAALLAAMLLTGCAAPAETPDTSPTEPPQETTAEEPKVVAPDFTVYDLEGNEVKLSDFLGKPVVLNFWASWCSPCKREMPDFNEIYLEMGDDVQFLMVNLTDGISESVKKASSFIAQQGYSFPVFYDTSGIAAMIYGVQSIPTTYFIDADGYAITYAVGAISGDVLRQGIDLIR